MGQQSNFSIETVTDQWATCVSRPSRLWIPAFSGMTIWNRLPIWDGFVRFRFAAREPDFR